MKIACVVRRGVTGKGPAHWVWNLAGGLPCDVELTAEDVVVLYFAGHGVTPDRDRHYLLCWDSDPDDLAATALATEDLVRILCRGKLRHLLLILDTCAGGSGTADAVSVALKTIAYRQSATEASSGLWFLASARRKDVADDGAFVTAFAEAIETTSRNTGQRQRYLNLTELMHTINMRFAATGISQRAEIAGGMVTDLAPFLPNSGYQADLPPAGTDLEIQRRASRDIQDHFGPRSRGVEFESEQGHYFSGRDRVLTELVTWLSASDGDGKGRIVTGNPGCGKSAVLGRIVALSDPGHRARANFLDADPATIIPVNTVSAAVLARRAGLEEVVAKIAQELGLQVDSPGALLQELSRRGQDRPLVIVIDALDEAGSATAADAGGRGEPRRIARELLRPMSEIAGVRLLVGTRRELLSSLGVTTFDVLDLDADVYRADADVAGYVSKILLAVNEPEVRTVYRDFESEARIVAAGVARRAAGVFLVARMTARSLRGEWVDTTVRGWENTLPSEIGAAVDDWLQRFGTEDEPRVRRLLLPLAFAEGQGLPRGEVWTTLSQALSGIACTEEDISWVLSVAEAYIAEVPDGAQSVYQLFHQALSDYLRDTARRRVEEIQKDIVTSLTRTVPRAPDGRRSDWFAATPYLVMHLPTHTAAAGLLSDYIKDPGFLLACNQFTLLRSLRSITGDEARRIRSAYMQAAHRLTQDRPLSSRASDLQISARRCGANACADRIEDLGIPLRWSARWAWWSASGAHRVLSGHTKEVECVAVGDLDGRPVAITGSTDGTARIWDLISQRQVGEPLEVGVSVSAVAIGELDDYTVGLTGGADGLVRVWDLSSGRELGASLSGHTNGIAAIAIGDVLGSTVALTASQDGTARLWKLSEREQFGPPMVNHRRTVNAAALTHLDGLPIAVTGGDDHLAYVWDLSELISTGGIPEPRPLIGHGDSVSAIAIARLNSRSVALIGDESGLLRLWDLAECQQIGEPLPAHVYYSSRGVLSITVRQTAGVDAFLTSGTHDARAWDLQTRRPRGHPMRGHAKYLTGAVLGGAPTVLSEVPDATLAVTVSEDHTARIWDLTTEQPTAGHTSAITSLALSEIDGRTFGLIGAADGTARSFNLHTREECWTPLEGHTEAINSLALAKVGGRIIAVTGSEDTTVRIWDPRTGQCLIDPISGHTNAVNCVTITELNGETALVSAGDDGTIRLWNALSGDPLCEPLAGHIGAINRLVIRVSASELIIGAVTASNHSYLWRLTTDLTALQLAHLDVEELASDGQVVGLTFYESVAVVLVGRADNRLHAFDISTGERIGKPLIGHTSSISFAAAGRIDGQPAIATMGYDNTIRIFDLLTGSPLKEPINTHIGGSKFAFGTLDGHPVGLAMDRQEVRLWDLRNVPAPVGEPLCGGQQRISAASFETNAQGRLVITDDPSGAIRVHRVSDGEQVCAHLTTGFSTRGCATVLIGDEIWAVIEGASEISVWNVTGRQKVGKISTVDVFNRDLSRSVTCQVGDRWIVVTVSERTLRLWNLLDQTPFGSPMAGHTASITDLATLITQEYNLLVSASNDGTVRVWDIQTCTPFSDPIKGHEQGANAVTIEELDGKVVLVTADAAGTIRSWDLLTMTPREITIPTNADEIRFLRLKRLRNRPHLIVADSSGRIQIWDFDDQIMVSEVNTESNIADVAVTDDGEICVATPLGIVLIQLALPDAQQ